MVSSWVVAGEGEVGAECGLELVCGGRKRCFRIEGTSGLKLKSVLCLLTLPCRYTIITLRESNMCGILGRGFRLNKPEL